MQYNQNLYCVWESAYSKLLNDPSKLHQLNYSLAADDLISYVINICIDII